ncbi:AraC family transcriptional regulator [Marinomonas lutimaris]|jgi:AraC-like DNA-binding protein|uniref:AraC family transcriptional regulator n=1 Tax=Marinomonas lutimaris TaxID=2846746 RepID=UPI001C67B702|nr:AraC family transcriptional regulator [Marinomonas lutimaris]
MSSTESFRYQHIEELPGLVISAATLTKFHFQPHYHLDYHIGLVTQGTQHQKVQHQTLDLVPGEICLMPPGEVHDGYGRDSTMRHLKTFRVPIELMQAALLDSQDRETNLQLAPSIINQPTHNSSFLQLAQAFDPSQYASQLHKDTLWANALSNLLFAAEKKPLIQENAGLTNQQIQSVRDYCEANLSSKISLNNLAEICELTRFQFIRRFQKQTGLAPHAWLMRLRLERACAQLAKTNAMITDIAADVGFYDQSHFNRAFKQAFGVAPSSYRS